MQSCHGETRKKKEKKVQDSDVRVKHDVVSFSLRGNVSRSGICIEHDRTQVKCIIKQLYIPLEISQQTVAELGELGQLQFLDVSLFEHLGVSVLTPIANQLNPAVNAFQRTFVNEIRRLDEMERKIRMFIDELWDDWKVFKELLAFQASS